MPSLTFLLVSTLATTGVLAIPATTVSGAPPTGSKNSDGVILPTRVVTTPACPQDNGAVYKAANGNVFVVECSTAHQGGDMSTITAKSLSACAEACASDARCVNASWNKQSACYLKKSLGTAISASSHGIKLISKGGAASSSPITTTPVAVATSEAATQTITTVVGATGGVVIPDLHASAPIAVATASVDSSGAVLGAQVVLVTVGNGPGVCAAAGGSSQITDWAGQNYTLKCGTDIPNIEDAIIPVHPYGTSFAEDWETCINLCTDYGPDCDGVVFTPEIEDCRFKVLRNQTNPIVQTGNSNKVFAYLADQVQVPFKQEGPYSDLTVFGNGRTTVHVIPATGTVAVPAVTTAIGTIAEATATVVGAQTIGVKIRMRYR